MSVLPIKALSDSSRDPLADPAIALLCKTNNSVHDSTAAVTGESYSLCKAAEMIGAEVQNSPGNHFAVVETRQNNLQHKEDLINM